MPTEQPALQELDDQDIAQIIYTDMTGVPIELDKVEALTWTSPTDPEAQVTAGNIEELLAYLSGLSIISTLPADTVLEDVGLDAPAYSITFIFEDKSTYKIEVGEPTAMSDGYYARIDGSPADFHHGIYAHPDVHHCDPTHSHPGPRGHVNADTYPINS